MFHRGRDRPRGYNAAYEARPLTRLPLPLPPTETKDGYGSSNRRTFTPEELARAGRALRYYAAALSWVGSRLAELDGIQAAHTCVAHSMAIWCAEELSAQVRKGKLAPGEHVIDATARFLREAPFVG